MRKTILLLVLSMLTLGTGFTAQASPAAGSATAPSAIALTILHTNDTHGHLLPFSYPSTVEAGSPVDGLTTRKDIGGIARRATLVARLRDELKAKGTTVWLMDAGDICDGTPFSTEYHGEADVAAMNAVGYDFGTLGNHEFNYKLDETRKRIAMAHYRLVCANAVDNTSHQPLTTPSLIEMAGPVRVGIFGLVTHESATYPAAKEGVTIEPEVETARSMVDSLRGKSDLIVLISHCGVEMDQKIAQEVPGIDVIVGGHSHTRLPVGEMVWRSDDLKPMEINGTIIVQAFQWGGELGRLDLLLEKDESGAWKIDRYRDRLLPITADIPEDPKVAAVIDQYWKPIAGKYGEVIGQATGDFSDRGDDAAHYNLMADAVRETMGTDIDLENTGGVRAPVLKGPITLGDLVTVDPFDNTVVTFRVTGKELREILLRTKPAVSGMSYRIEDRQLVAAIVGGQPLDDARTYTAAANSYFAEHSLKSLTVKDTGRKRLDVLIAYVRKEQTVKPRYDGRRVVIGGEE